MRDETHENIYRNPFFFRVSKEDEKKYVYVYIYVKEGKFTHELKWRENKKKIKKKKEKSAC